MDINRCTLLVSELQKRGGQECHGVLLAAVDEKCKDKYAFQMALQELISAGFVVVTPEPVKLRLSADGVENFRKMVGCAEKCTKQDL